MPTLALHRSRSSVLCVALPLPKPFDKGDPGDGNPWHAVPMCEGQFVAADKVGLDLLQDQNVLVTSIDGDSVGTPVPRRGSEQEWCWAALCRLEYNRDANEGLAKAEHIWSVLR